MLKHTCASVSRLLLRLRLHFAAEFGSAKCAALLLDKGCSCDIKSDVKSGGRTALHQASLYGHTDCVRLLLQRGADINSREKLGKTALHFAAQCDKADVVRLLLQSGADKGAGDGIGRTASDVAGSDEVKALLTR